MRIDVQGFTPIELTWIPITAADVVRCLYILCAPYIILSCFRLARKASMSGQQMRFWALGWASISVMYTSFYRLNEPATPLMFINMALLVTTLIGLRNMHAYVRGGSDGRQAE